MATPRAAQHNDLISMIKDLQRQVRDLSSIALGRKINPVFAGVVYAENNSLNLPTAGTYYYAAPVTVPAGYGQLRALTGVAAGTSFTSTPGNVTVQPVFRWNGDDNKRFYGPAINSGNSNVSVANSFWACTADDILDAGYQSLEVGIYTATSGAAANAGAGNWHISSSLIWLN